MISMNCFGAVSIVIIVTRDSTRLKLSVAPFEWLGIEEVVMAMLLKKKSETLVLARLTQASRSQSQYGDARN